MPAEGEPTTEAPEGAETASEGVETNGPARTGAGRAEQLRLRDRVARLRNLRLLGGVGVSAELARLERQIERIAAEPSAEDVWRSVELARHQDRPYTLDYVSRILDDFVELHGDRSLADDAAIVAGLGSFRGRTVALVGHQKGRDIRERTRRNFGMPYPEGYRKAMRVMELADRHGFPVFTLVDTPGAYPGLAAEQHGQGGWIARCQLAMVRLGVPSVTCVIGEGGSGGAVAIAVADRVLMQEHAIYSVISPEGCAAILWRDAGEAKKAAAAFKPDARHCLDLGVIDSIVPEPGEGAHADHDEAARLLADALAHALVEIDADDADERRLARRARFRQMGVFLS
jgi:acetyl-CoA carboxylase carboxyl transferase subunit alpha